MASADPDLDADGVFDPSAGGGVGADPQAGGDAQPLDLTAASASALQQAIAPAVHPPARAGAVQAVRNALSHEVRAGTAAASLESALCAPAA